MIAFFVFLWCVFLFASVFILWGCLSFIRRKRKAYKSGTLNFSPNNYPINPVGKKRLKQIFEDGIIRFSLEKICLKVGEGLVLINIILFSFLLVFFFEPSSWHPFFQAVLGVFIFGAVLFYLSIKLKVLSAQGAALHKARSIKDMYIVCLSCFLYVLLILFVFLGLHYFIPFSWLVGEIFGGIQSAPHNTATAAMVESSKMNDKGSESKKDTSQKVPVVYNPETGEYIQGGKVISRKKEKPKKPEVKKAQYELYESKTPGKKAYSFYFRIKEGFFDFKPHTGFSKKAKLESYNPDEAYGVIVDGQKKYQVIFSMATGEFYFK